MVPHVIERSSRLSTLEPVRVFKPAPHTHELALTYVTGAGNVYWNVIETNWKDAPILAPRDGDTTGSRAASTTSSRPAATSTWSCSTRAGRRYWVVNTLRDELSNETMLAIAKGLQPLAK